MARKTPEHWQRAMDRKGVGSLRRLAESAGIAHTAVTRLVHGDGVSSDATVLAVSKALGLSLDATYKLAGITTSEASLYKPPQEANRMNERQRKAVDELIRAFITEQQEARHDRQVTESGQEAGSTVDGGEDRPEDGSTTGGREAPMSELEKRRQQRRQDEIDSANFGTKHKPGDLEDLQRRQDEADQRDLSDLTGYAADEGPFMDGDE